MRPGDEQAHSGSDASAGTDPTTPTWRGPDSRGPDSGGTVSGGTDSGGMVSSGWHPDPQGRYEYRYHNGRSWTADVATDGQRLVDPGSNARFSPATAGNPNAGYPIASRRSNPEAITALCTGIVAVAIGIVPWVAFVGLALAVTAIVFGQMGRRKDSAGAGRGGGRSGMATAGVALGVAGLAISILGIAFTVIISRSLNEFANPGPVSSKVTECTVDDGFATVSGRLNNRSTTDRAYSVVVLVELSPSSNGTLTLITETAEVTHGVEFDWKATSQAPLRATGCKARAYVFGPLPFGVASS